MQQFAAAALSAFFIIGFPSAPRATPAVDNGNGGTYVCEGNASDRCLDLGGNNTSANQQIWIYSSAPGSGATGLGWNLFQQATVCDGGSCGAPGPFTSGSGLNSRYNGQPVYYIEKEEGSGHDGCAGAYEGLVSWEPCGQDGTRWVLSNDDYFINVYYSDQDGQPIAMTALGTSNESAVVINTLNSGGSQVWGFHSPSLR